MKDLVIIGAGPAGLSAALYGARAGLDLIVLESNFMAGGQVLNTYEVDNYLGLPDSNGFDLGMKFKEHVEKLGVEIVSTEVEELAKTEEGFGLKTSDGEIACKAVILATGAVNRKLAIPGEEEFLGRGVGYCATCDGAFYRGKVTAVIGGSYQAVEDVIYLSALCEKVYLVHRRDELRAGAVLEAQLKKLPNVEIIWNHIPLEIKGTEVVEQLVVEDVNTKVRSVIKADGVFVAIGTIPKTELAQGITSLDDQGYVMAGENGETGMPGFFVAGDIRTKQLRQIITAVADGANAATTATAYLKEQS
jgi:thioredoxin reductase (NADPH)